MPFTRKTKHSIDEILAQVKHNPGTSVWILLAEVGISTPLASRILYEQLHFFTMYKCRFYHQALIFVCCSCAMMLKMPIRSGDLGRMDIIGRTPIILPKPTAYLNFIQNTMRDLLDDIPLDQ